MGWYKGKEPCQGCGRTGVEEPRVGKTKLCDGCAKILEDGKHVQFLESVKYARVRLHLNAYSNDWLNEFSHSVLGLLHTPGVDGKNFNPDGWHDLKPTFGDNKRSYDIPARFLEPLTRLFLELDDTLKDLGTREKEIPRKAKEEVSKEYDRIFMEGVKKGRNLLVQLNKGELTEKDLEKNYSYYERLRE